MISPKGRVFEVSPYWAGGLSFQVGTCHGLFEQDNEIEALVLIAIVNDDKGNGDFLDALWFFEQSVRDDTCKRFYVVAFTNPRLRKWFLKRGYSEGLPLMLTGDLINDWVEFKGERCQITR